MVEFDAKIEGATAFSLSVVWMAIERMYGVPFTFNPSPKLQLKLAFQMCLQDSITTESFLKFAREVIK